jgi:hypothetical protein
MADMLENPYAGVESETDQQAVYQKLQEQHKNDLAVWERRKTIYNDQMEIWRYQRDIQRSLDERFHKNTLTIAAGSFGVSFAFISQIVQLEQAINTPILIMAWALFGLSIILSILNLKIGSAVQDVLLDTIEQNIERGYAGKPTKEAKRWLIMWPDRIISWLSFAAFVSGVICLLYFVLINTPST